MRMKIASKLISLMFVMVVVASIFGQTAIASKYDQHADTLNRLGLFLGTDAGYELEKQVTRAQAATMLVRLLGVEKEVRNGNYSHPFTDVPGWADKSIAYMYSTGLTKGVSDNAFDPNGLCNLQMYSTFVLRALGYDDGSDFTYATAIESADKLGLLDTITTRDHFLRGDMVAVSYSALATKIKNNDNNLLDKLVTNGAVDAERVQEIFATNTGSDTGDGNIGNNENTQDSTIDNDGLEDVRIKLTFNNEEVIVKMDDNPTSRDFLASLPLTIKLEDHAETEKISYLTKKLSTAEAPSGSDPSIGDFAYYSPWGNLAIYYKDFDYSSGLIKLGKIETGIEKLASLSGEFTVTIEKMD